MAKITSIRVNERNTAGKGAARAERRAGLIPGVIYGEKKEPVMFSISALDLDAQMRQKGFWTRQFEIEVGKNKYHAICQDIQTHPITDRPIHIDFLRVSANTELQIEVPVMYENELSCPGMKLGGVLNAPVTGQSPKEGLSVFGNVMPILVIGGLRNMDGCLPAALLVGLVNAFGAIYLPQYYNVLPAALMVIAMAINPQGLFTKKEGR